MQMKKITEAPVSLIVLSMCAFILAVTYDKNIFTTIVSVLAVSVSIVGTFISFQKIKKDDSSQ